MCCNGNESDKLPLLVIESRKFRVVLKASTLTPSAAQVPKQQQIQDDTSHLQRVAEIIWSSHGRTPRFFKSGITAVRIYRLPNFLQLSGCAIPRFFTFHQIRLRNYIRTTQTYSGIWRPIIAGASIDCSFSASRKMWKIRRWLMFFRPLGWRLQWNSNVKAETISIFFLYCKIRSVALSTPEITVQQLVDNEVIEDLNCKSVTCGTITQWTLEPS